MAGDGTSRVNTEELLRAVGEITSIKKSVAANTDAAYAHFRKLQDSYAGESADDIYAVAGQLKKSSGYYYHAGKLRKGLKGISRCI